MDLFIDFSKVKIERLSKTHDTSKFDCGDPDINNFLKNDAISWQERQIAVTMILHYNGEIIGFFCSSADSIKLKEFEKKNEKGLNSKHIRALPAVKIGRLGRSINHKRRGLGEFILKWSIGHIFAMTKHTGIYFVTVDAYPSRVGWYEQFGFKKNLHDDYQNKDNVSMRLCIYNPLEESRQN